MLFKIFKADLIIYKTQFFVILFLLLISTFISSFSFINVGIITAYAFIGIQSFLIMPRVNTTQLVNFTYYLSFPVSRKQIIIVRNIEIATVFLLFMLIPSLASGNIENLYKMMTSYGLLLILVALAELVLLKVNSNASFFLTWMMLIILACSLTSVLSFIAISLTFSLISLVISLIIFTILVKLDIKSFEKMHL